MSAWVVDKVHIDLLVRAALNLGQPDGGFSWWKLEEGVHVGWRQLDEQAEFRGQTFVGRRELVSPSQFGQLLVSANVSSVHARYPDAGEPLPGPGGAYYLAPYVYANPGHTLSPGELFSALDCFEYQSYEHAGWRSSEAYQIAMSLRRMAGWRVDGYAGSPWGWTSRDLQRETLRYSAEVRP